MIGTYKNNQQFNLNIETLIQTRLLCQANSGGGKSWLLRKILEETNNKVQQIIIDLEGEFSSLRESYDYLIIGKDGDIPIDIKIASLLPKKIIESEISCILDISELKQHERILFVKRFLEGLINLPKKYWKPLLVIVDEAHQFCPEKGKCESSPSVIDLMTRGRKRGYCGCLATQRLSKLNKDAAAEANNVLIGRTGLDIDMKRAGDTLGFNKKEDMLGLRQLAPGTFYAFGPAFETGVNEVKIGDVKTTHPKVGFGKMLEFTPKPTAKVKKILEQLKDLDVESKKELIEIEDYKEEIKKLRAKNTILENKKSIPPQDRQAEYDRGYQEAMRKKEKYSEVPLNLLRDIRNVVNILQPHINDNAHLLNKKTTKNITVSETNAMISTRRQPTKGVELSKYQGETNLRPGAKRMLRAIVEKYPEMISKEELGEISEVSISGGSFSSYLSNLKTNNLVTVNREGVKAHTELMMKEDNK